MQDSDACSTARRTLSSLRRLFWLPLVALLLVQLLSGCTRAVQADPLFQETPVARPTPAHAAQKPDSESTYNVVSLDTLRSLFTGGVALLSEDASSAPYADKTALHSPLATPPVPADASGQSVIIALPTLTPAPGQEQPTAHNQSPTIVPTAAITDLLVLAVPTAMGALDTAPIQDQPSAAQLPTPTPHPAPSAPVDPVSDGIARAVRVPILMYHYLSVPPADADIYRQDLSVAPELFAAHLDAMQAAGYTTIKMYDLVAHLNQGAPLPEKPVVITFDDGYRDNYENALPLLRERDMVATFFVVTDFIDERRPAYLSWDMAREMLAAGMDIESHGRNHVSLQGKDIDYLVWQALGSLETIEYELGVRPRFVSYPAGEYDRTTADVFASAGYWAGATTVQGATHTSDALFDLRRVRVRGTTTPEELLRLLALDW